MPSIKTTDSYFDKNRTLLEYIDKVCLDTLEKCEITVLLPMNYIQIKIALDLINDYPELYGGTIRRNGVTYVVIKPKRYKNFDYRVTKKVLQDASSSYSKRDYKSAINFYLQAIKATKSKAEIYGRLGIAYLKNLDIKKSLDCFIIAEFLSQKQKKKNDYTPYIRYATKLLKENENYKPFSIMEPSIFDYIDMEDYYETIDYQLIYEYIMKIIKSSLSFQEACLHLNIAPKEIDIIYLINARNCYLKGQLKKGDEFLVKVERRKNKPKKVISIMKEVRLNRKFYQYREVKETIDEIPYILKPKN